MAENLMPQIITVEPNSAPDFTYTAPESKKTATKKLPTSTPSSAMKIYSPIDIYEASPVSHVMNWMAALMIVFGSMLILWAEVSFTEAEFQKTELSFAKSEVISDRLSVHNKLAYADITLPKASLSSDSVATNPTSPTVLGETDVKVPENDEDSEEVLPTDTPDTVDPEAEEKADESGPAEDATDDILQQIEDSEDRVLAAEIKLDFDARTTDRTPEITFEKTGVTLSIDGGAFVAATSPFALPEVGVGKHDIKLKYTSTSGQQEISFSLLVVPETPKISPIKSSNVTKEGFVTISGTAVALSTVRVTVASEVETGEVTANSTGKWEFTTTRALDEGQHTVVAQSIIDGVTSDSTTPTNFEVGESNVSNLPLTGDLDISPNVLLIIFGALVAGIVLAIIWMRLFGAENETELQLAHTGGTSLMKMAEKADKHEDHASKDMDLSKAGEVASVAPMKAEEPLLDEKAKTLSKDEFLKEYTSEVKLPDKKTSRTKTPPIGVSLL